MTDAEPNSDDVFDIERIRHLVELMEEHGLSEIDLRRRQQRIRLRRGVDEGVAAIPAALPPIASLTPLVESGALVDEDQNIVLIRSPMVGTFYGRPNPEAEPFVKIGDRISSDRTVCIIEAMKVFNEIPAEVAGMIVAQLADDDEPVDFGKPLFKVDTSK